MGYELGVDLGTTYTSAATARAGRAEIVGLGNRGAVIPSVVFVRPDGKLLVGEGADRRAVTEPGQVVREFKRRIGDPTPITVGGGSFTAHELMAAFLPAVLEAVAAKEGALPDRVALTHPANWSPTKVGLLVGALDRTNLPDIVTVTEPEAAAIAYAAAERIDPGAIVAVYDLGGGTFDAALLRRTTDRFEIIGQPEGLDRLGGVDFDAAVFAHVNRFLDAALDGVDHSDPATAAGISRLRADCVEAKEALSADTDVAIPVMLPGLRTEVRMTRTEFEAMIRPALSDTVGALRRAMRSAGVVPADVEVVLLVGGSSRIPLVAQLVGAEVGRPVAVDIHPKHVVALGAALVASIAEPVTHIMPGLSPAAQGPSGAAGTGPGPGPGPLAGAAPFPPSGAQGGGPPLSGGGGPPPSADALQPPAASPSGAAPEPSATGGNGVPPVAAAVALGGAATDPPLYQPGPSPSGPAGAPLQAPGGVGPAAGTSGPGHDGGAGNDSGAGQTGGPPWSGGAAANEGPGGPGQVQMPAAAAPERQPFAPTAPARRSRRAPLLVALGALIAIVAAVVIVLSNNNSDPSAGPTSTASPTGPERTTSSGPSASATSSTGPSTTPSSASSGTPATTSLTSEPTTAPPPTPSTLAPDCPARPAGLQACITAVAVDPAGKLSVTWQAFGYTPKIADDPASHHAHFYFPVKTMALNPANAGVVANPAEQGTWVLWDQLPTFNGYTAEDARTAGSPRICVIVSNSDHTVQVGTGNCLPIPA